MRAALLAAALASGAYAQNAPPGGDPAAQSPAQLRQSASAALNQKDPARAVALADQVQPGDKEYGAAQALKARALQQMGDAQGALAAWRNALKDPAQRAAATANIKLLGGRVDGGGSDAGAAPGAAPAAARPAAAGSSYNGLNSHDLTLIASMFRSRDASQTLAATLRKAAQGDASGMADLRRHGIDFARGPAEQTDAVVVENRNGAQVVTFSPAVLDNPNKNSAIATMANGVEQGATQRDYNGISLMLRQWGGRLVGLLVYMQLSPQEPSAKSVPDSDKRVVSDRIAFQYVLPQTPFPTPPLGGGGAMFGARVQAQGNHVTDPAVGFLYFCGAEARQPMKPDSLTGSDLEYFTYLKSLPR